MYRGEPAWSTVRIHDFWKGDSDVYGVVRFTDLISVV